MSEVVPAPDDRRAFMVVHGRTEQSWVDPSDPLRLEFEYVQRIAEVLESGVLARPAAERVRIVHIGGGGLTLPRYVEARRPRTAQVVMEPDEALTAQVRAKLPLPRHSGIRIRPVDGRTGAAQLPAACADTVIVDAFAGASVPAELATTEFLAELARALRDGGLVIMNLTDQAPFGWSRRTLAGFTATFGQVAVSAEVPVWKGRRFGNLVVAAGADVPVQPLERHLARAPFPYRLLHGRELGRWIGGAVPFTDTDAEPSPSPAWSRGWFS
ncbi:spermidine synthase [Propionicimonas sp.]|uniref:spermidine synthase n=1 Tax=Propionicimonas sp. TaxID=1955623 RepID=UPI0039E5CEBD